MITKLDCSPGIIFLYVICYSTIESEIFFDILFFFIRLFFHLIVVFQVLVIRRDECLCAFIADISHCISRQVLLIYCCSISELEHIILDPVTFLKNLLG